MDFHTAITLQIYSGKNCSVCQALKPKLLPLGAQYPEVEVEVVEVEKNPEKAAQNFVFSLPVVLIKVEGKEWKRFAGSFSTAEIQDAINQIIARM